MTLLHPPEQSAKNESFALSTRARLMPASPIRKLAPLAEAAKARGSRVLHLNIGQPDIETPACMRERLALLDAKVLEYSPSTGTPEFLRDSLQSEQSDRYRLPRGRTGDAGQSLPSLPNSFR